MRNVLLANNTSPDTTSENKGGGLGVGLSENVSLVNVTVTDNFPDGIWVDDGRVNLLNAIVWGNNDVDFTGSADAVYLSHTLYGVGEDIVNEGDNIQDDPLFINPAEGDYRLQHGSPAIDTGLNQDWMQNAVDLSGNPRILMGTVDMGCYETIPPAGTLFLMR